MWLLRSTVYSIGRPHRRAADEQATVAAKEAMLGLRFIRQVLAVIGLFLTVAASLGVAAGGWLYMTQPHPRAVAAWTLGPSLPGPRGELATAVGYEHPCPRPPCPEAERLYVLGGLSGLYRPRRRVSVYNPNRNVWSTGPSLPA